MFCSVALLDTTMVPYRHGGILKRWGIIVMASVGFHNPRYKFVRSALTDQYRLKDCDSTIFDNTHSDQCLLKGLGYVQTVSSLQECIINTVMWKSLLDMINAVIY